MHALEHKLSKLFILILLITLKLIPAKSLAADLHPGYYKKLNDNTYILSLRRGARLIESLKAFQKKAAVQSASVTGIGLLRDARVAQFRFIGESLVDGKTATVPKWPGLDSTVVKGNREIVSLICNLTTNKIDQNGDVNSSDPHCHVALAGSDSPQKDSKDGYPVVGGHLFEGEIGLLAELTITTYPVVLNKRFEPSLNVFVIDINEKNGGTAISY